LTSKRLCVVPASNQILRPNSQLAISLEAVAENSDGRIAESFVRAQYTVAQYISITVECLSNLKAVDLHPAWTLNGPQLNVRYHCIF